MRILYILPTGLIMDGISSITLNYWEKILNKDICIDFAVPVVIESVEKKIRKTDSKIYLIEGRKTNPVKYMRKLYKLIKDNQYDIVHANGSSAMLTLEMLAAKKAGCKIRIAHSHNTKTNYPIVDKLLRPIFKTSYTHAFACGEEAGKWLFGKRKFEVINNGRDVEKFEYNQDMRKKLRKEYNLENQLVLGHVGTFNYQKNHEYLIDVFSELIKNSEKKYKLILIGDGKYKSAIEEKVKKLNIQNNVIFVGRTNEVQNWLQAMDIMIFPSRFEGFPVVLVEWQIDGLPCIISDKITDKVKLTDLVQFESIEKSPKEWAKKIENTRIEDREKSKPKILKQIKESGFDIKENAKELEKIYESLLREEQK